MTDGLLGKWFPELISAVVLSVFAVIGSTLVSLAFQGTEQRIAQNERDALMRQMAAILPPERYDNDLLADTTEVLSPADFGETPTTIYRARKGGENVAAVFSPVTTPGYSGDVVLIVGVYTDGSVAGVRVLNHKETPGLGDKIEVKRHPWILDFAGKWIGNPPDYRWKVKRDGGDFDQFTGATITPRTVVAAVRRTLQYFNNYRQEIFAESEAEPSSAKKQFEQEAGKHG